MPTHRKPRGSEFHHSTGYLKMTLCDIHDEVTQQLDTQAIAILL